jgi:nucleotide-binding universal stress UspA family protein
MEGYFARIFTLIDDTPSSRAAVDLALQIAHDHRSELILAQASADRGADNSLPAIVARASGLSVVTTALDEPLVPAIRWAVREHGATAAVVGSHGAGGIVRTVNVPTIVAHEHPSPERSPEKTAFERILVAVDDSPPADQAIDFGIELAAEYGSELIFLHVVQPAEIIQTAAEYGYDPVLIVQGLREDACRLLDHAKERATRAGLRPLTMVTEGSAVDGILHAAETHNADLAVLGTHGRRGLYRFVLGSVAEGVIRDSRIAVAVVHGLQPVKAAKPQHFHGLANLCIAAG